jgi:hypothetical protein
VRKKLKQRLIEYDANIFCQFALNEKQIGSLAHSSRFLVKLIASFQNKVKSNLILYKYKIF